MRIKQLILNGFKSFPEKTTITFEPTINAIIGPNGCGKTNILDGLRWVMGETSYSQMRCAKTEDLIFSGNTKYAPINYAEVVLVLQNDKPISIPNTNSIPTSSLYISSEIEIKRRFFRSGESEFFINRKPCKLKDIQDLLTSGGGSGHAYSIFDLPKMRQIISSNLKDLFIEAAGLAFYEERKNEIERKLKLTTDDLLRINDIIQERDRITRSLKRQAYRLMAFERTKQQERELLCQLMKFEYEKICADEQIVSEEIKVLQQAEKNLMAKINELESRRTVLKTALAEKELQRQNLQKEIEITREDLIKCEERIKANQDKQNYLKEQQRRIQSDTLIVEDLAVNQKKYETKHQYLAKTQELLTAKEQELNELRKQTKFLEQEIFTESLALEQLQEQEKQIITQLSTINAEITATETKLESLLRYQETLQDSLVALSLAQSCDAKLLTPLTIQDKMQLKEKLGPNFIGTVKDLIKIQPEYKPMLDSVLFGIGEAIIINAIDDLPIGELSQEKDLLMILQTWPWQKINYQSDVPQLPQLTELLEYKTELPNLIKSMLDTFFIVDDWSQIMMYYPKYAHCSFVTKSGIALFYTGLLVLPGKFSTQKLSAELQEKLQGLQKEKEIIHSKKIEFEQKLQLLREEKQTQEAHRIQLQSEINRKSQIIADKKKTVKQNLEIAGNMVFDLAKQREELIQIRAELDFLKDEINRQELRKDSMSAENEKLAHTLSTLCNEENELRQQIIELNEKLTDLKKQWDELSQDTLTQEYDALETKIRELRLTADNQKQKINEQFFKKYEIERKRQEIEQQARSLLPNGIEILKSPLTESETIETIQNRLRSVQKKIELIGKVNPLAKEEYEKEKTELDKLINQRADVVNAQDNLTQALQTLTQRAQQMFLDTYNAVRISFQRIFKEIFLEGEADLILESQTNPLESEIKIIAQPRGKTPKRLDQLSDGEKALLALSLLFAFYDIKPAPFCFMDEVDAPLDDANVKRFTQFLKRVSETTQVIIITHNRLTIEAAAAVIGVTTEEVGVSKIVSVRFKDIPNLNNK
ncbi:MAG: AAA family ATPase [candidate division WOR-3 bacterium]|nr:AAA family ATPase [candidate division WOR-3 bacterium]